MGQNRLYINYTFTGLLFGVLYERGWRLELWIGFIKIGIGLTDSAQGFGCWKI
jgi:hypothetical protein